MSVWAIGTTRNEVDLVAVNVQHHLAQGIDRFLLLDNGSIDGTPDLLQHLARQYPIEWSCHRGAFHQHTLLTRLAHEAFARGAEWVIPVDADEFWHAPGTTLRQVLGATTAGSLRVELVNFVQHRAQRVTTPDALLRMRRRVATPVGPMDRAEDLVEGEQIAYVEHQYHYKWISRSSPALEIGWGNHVIHGGRGPAIPAPEIVCLHAPLRSYAILEAKVDAARPPAEVDDYFGIAWHLRRWRRLFWENRLEAEWRANSYDDAGMLDVHGRSRPLLVDDTLARLVEPWLNGAGCGPDRTSRAPP